MRIKSFKFIFVMLLLCISLFGIGFASWTVIQPTEPENTNGSFDSDDVENISDNIEIKAVKLLSYSKGGFIGEDRTTGNMSYKIRIDLTNSNLILNESKNILVTIDLTYNNESEILDIFQYATHEAINADGSVLNSTKADYRGFGYSSKQQFNVSSENPIIEFDIIYTFIINEDLIDTYFNNENSPLTNNTSSVFKITTVLSVM